jgi:hypothetical protein
MVKIKDFLDTTPPQRSSEVKQKKKKVISIQNYFDCQRGPDKVMI